MSVPIVIAPLLPNYKTIHIRTTTLEKFWNCPMNFKKVEVDWNKSFFDFWKIAHNAIQAYIFNLDIKDDILDFVCTYKEDYCDKITSYLNLVKTEMLWYWYKPILNEVNWVLEIHNGEYKIEVEGTADLIMKRNNIDWYIIWDIKTSKSEWKENMFKNKLQKYVYTYLIWQKVWFDSIFWFEYFIFTKHVHPRIQVLWEYNITKEKIEEKLISLVISYISCLEHDEWPAIKNNYCYSCPLKKQWVCPEYWGNDFNL